MAEAISKEEEKYYMWPETIWINKDINWEDAEIITAGVDLGSVSTQFVIMTDGELFAYINTRTKTSAIRSAEESMNRLLEKVGMKREDIHYIISTGYGRVSVPFADRSVTEIACHARGANFFYGPSVRTIVDMGGQDLKVIRCDERGKVVNFVMNDKCAAGTGRGVETVCQLLKVPITKVGELSLQVEKEPEPISSTCVVFAKSEILNLIREGKSTNEILAAFFNAMSDRVVELMERVGIEPELGITGGLSKNVGLVKRIERKIGREFLKPNFDTQIAGAVGAALFAKALYEKKVKGKK